MTSLTIIIAVHPSAGEVRSASSLWLSAAIREARSVGGRVLLVGSVDESDQRMVDEARRAGAEIEVIAASGLTPELWGVGLRSTEAHVVAFSIGECILDEGWARTALREIEGGAAGVGGGFRLAANASPTARAIYFLRYSAYLESSVREPREVADIAGDNAAYRRDLLLRHGTYEHGFWEVEAHRHLRAHGERLVLVPGMAASFGGDPDLRGFMGQRFAHGRQFGRYRANAGRAAAWRITAASPLVPLVLLTRAAQRVRRGGGSIRQLAGCAAPFLALATAWAAGEARGALDGLMER